MTREAPVKLQLRPISLRDSNDYVVRLHRHHGPTRGHKFSIAATDETGILRGVAITGRPVARGADDGFTAEVLRLCTDQTRNACSLLYAASARAAKAMGYRKIQTYILASEAGISLQAAGWKCVGKVSGRSWSCQSRPRDDKHPTEDKTRWEKDL